MSNETLNCRALHFCLFFMFFRYNLLPGACVWHEGHVIIFAMQTQLIYCSSHPIDGARSPM